VKSNTPQQATSMHGEEQAVAMTKNKCKTKEKQDRKHNLEKQKKHTLTTPKNFLGFIFFSFCGLPWWRCCPKP
jgi:hypothetical protein